VIRTTYTEDKDGPVKVVFKPSIVLDPKKKPR